MTLISCIDFETLGTSVKAPLVSVGVAVCDKDASEFKLYDYYHSHIDFDTRGFNSIGDMTPDTLRWWMTQASQEARDATFQVPSSGSNIDQIFSQLCSFFEQLPIKEVWSKGADFDIAIFKYRCEQLGLEVPFHYRTQRCYRTLEAMFHLQVPEKEKKHTSLEDASFELEQVYRLHQESNMARSAGMIAFMG